MDGAEREAPFSPFVTHFIATYFPETVDPDRVVKSYAHNQEWAGRSH